MAKEEDEYLSILQLTGEEAPSASGRRLLDIVHEQHALRSAKTRQLRQVSEDTVGNLLGSVNALRTSQGELKKQVVELSSQVREANIAAEARAQDKTLENLINAGRQDILVGQARVESLLAQIIGKQNLALAAAEQAQVRIPCGFPLVPAAPPASLQIATRTRSRLAGYRCGHACHVAVRAASQITSRMPGSIPGTLCAKVYSLKTSRPPQHVRQAGSSACSLVPLGLLLR